MKNWVLLFTLAVFPLAAQDSLEVEVTGDIQFKDTGMDVKAGDTLTFTVSGTLQYPAPSPGSVGPTGQSRNFRDLIKNYPVNSSGRGAAIGRIGSNDAARAFLIGASLTRKAATSGRLFVGINQTGNDRADGSFKVKIERTAGPDAPANGDPNTAVTKVTQEQLDSLPPRVSDAAGNPGDRINFILVGSEDQVKGALEKAGWVIVDKDVKTAVFQSIFATISKQAYVTMPMSELKLFGRSQDYGYAQGDPLRVVASRHHFRIWKAPFQAGTQTVWIGAGTHDIGFDRDQRNNKVTHKIDPDTDLERDYIGRSLAETGSVVSQDYMVPKDTVKEAKTAHGEAFHSDGRTLVVYLNKDAASK